MNHASGQQPTTVAVHQGSVRFGSLSGVLLLATVALLAATFICFWVLPSWMIANLMPDDAFYYFKIARNFVKGQGFSFDAINPTNGYQPLWMYMLLPAAYLTREMHVEVFPRLALFYQGMLLVLAVAVLHSALRRCCNASVLLLSDAISLLLGLRLFVNGMETVVVFLVFALSTWYVSRRETGSLDLPYYAAAGVLSALIFLARLDSVFIILVWFVLHAVQGRRTGLQWSHLGIMVAVTAVIAAPYLLYNLWAFGDWMPISGRLKNSFPRIEQLDWQRVPPQHYPALVASSLALGWLWRRTERQRVLMWFLLAWVVGSWVHALHTVLFMKWAVFKWHFSPYWMPLTVLIPLVLQEWHEVRSAVWSHVAGVVLWGIGLLSVAHFVHESLFAGNLPTWATVAYRAAVWARQNTPPDAVFAMKDAGRFGYYSDRRVINLDGLVNNMELQEYLRSRRLAEYLRNKGVRYLVQHAISMRFRVEHAPAVINGTYSQTHLSYMSRLYSVESDAIPLRRERERFRDYHRDGVFLIWEIR